MFGKKVIYPLLFFYLTAFNSMAQFAPAAGQPGSSAVKKDSSAIVNWATSCKVVRGLMDISDPGGGYASVGDSSEAIGAADGIGVVSLGDGGWAILTFQSPITNGPGNDFCVFENSFHPGFLELASVEVSSDGINFVRFPSTCLVQNSVQIGPFDTSSDPAKINNLAGKYIGNYGTPFDLEELQGHAELDIDQVTHVKIIDVVGCIQAAYARYDSNNNVINDLWATPFASGGFDLDAVGVMHQQPVSLKEREPLEDAICLYPVPAKNSLSVNYKGEGVLETELLDSKGKVLQRNFLKSGRNAISIKELECGVYVLKVFKESTYTIKKFVKIDDD